MEALSLPLAPVSAPDASVEPRPARPSRSPAVSAEPLTPFVPWSAEERAPLPEVEPAPLDERHLLADLLREPSAVVERLLDPARLQGLVVGSVGVIAGCTAFFAATVSAARGEGEAGGLASVLTALNVLLSLAVSLGPIYVTGILVASRVPLARLVAALLASAATGVLLLAGLAPPLYLLWGLDSEWAGPLMLTAAFLLSGAAAGARIHRLLNLMAQTVTRAALGRPTAVLSEADAFRVGILARVACMLVAFSLALGFWGFDALA
jgi:hypothetical protein